MILLINTSRYSDLGYFEFVRPLERIISNLNLDYKVKHYLNIGNVDEFDKIIICGTHLRDNLFLKNFDKFSWIKDFLGKILGICAGCEIIAKIFGGELKKSCKIGFMNVNVIKENSILNRERFKVYFLHNYGLKLNGNFEIIAKLNSDAEAFKVKKRDFYGLMFHPEVRNHWIIENFLNL